MCCWLTEAPASCLTSNTRSSKNTETPFFSPKEVPEIHAGRVRPASEEGIKQCRTGENHFYAFTMLNLLFPLSLSFSVTNNYPKLTGFTCLAVQNTRLGKGSGLKGVSLPPSSVGQGCLSLGSWSCGSLPLFSLDTGSNCLQLQLVLPHLPWVAQRYSCSIVDPQRHPRLFLASWCSLVFQYGLAASLGSWGHPGKPTLLLLATQVS